MIGATATATATATTATTMLNSFTNQAQVPLSVSDMDWDDYPPTTQNHEIIKSEEDTEQSESEISYTSSDTSDDDFSEDETNPYGIQQNEAILRLLSGKTIAHRSTRGPGGRKQRHRRSVSPKTSANKPSTQRKLQGNCAMIPSAQPSTTSTTATTSPVRQPSPETPTSVQQSQPESSSPTRNTSSQSRRTLPPTRHLTIRNSDAQMLASLPASTQYALMATQQKAISRASRAEQRFRGKMDSQGNLKVKERFVNDVPGGRSHRNRFMAQ